MDMDMDMDMCKYIYIYIYRHIPKAQSPKSEQWRQNSRQRDR